MKYLILFLLLLPLSLIGQVESQFNGTLNVFSGSRIGSTNTFTISGIFNSTTTSYTSANSATGDIVQVQSGSRFYWLHIYSIASNSGGVITCNVRDSSSTLTTFPLGKWSIFRPTPNLRLPLSPDGESNASKSATFNTLALRVDEIQSAVSSATNCEQTITKTAHGFRKWTPIFYNGSTYIRPTNDSIVPDYIVVDSLTANTFKVPSCGTYSTVLANGLYWYTNNSPGYSLTPDTTKVPLFQVIDSVLILDPIVGFNLMSGSGSGDVTSAVLADTAAAIRADFPNGIISALPNDSVGITSMHPLRISNPNGFVQIKDGKFIANWKSDNVIISAYNNRPIIDDGAAVSVGCCEDSIMYGGVLVGMYSSLKKGGVGYFSTVVGYNSEADSTIKYTLVGTKNRVFGVRSDAALLGNYIDSYGSVVFGVGQSLRFNHNYSGLFGYGMATDKIDQFKYGIQTRQVQHDFLGNLAIFDSTRTAASFVHDSRKDTTLIHGTAVFGKPSSLGSPTATGYSHIFRHPSTSSTAVLIESGRTSPTGGTAGIRMLPSGLWSAQIEYGSATSNALSFYSHRLGRNTLFLGSSGFVAGSPRTIIVGYSDDPGQWSGNAAFVVYDTITSGKALAVFKKITSSSTHIATFSSASNDRMTIEDDGDVKIGTGAASAKFHVAGDCIIESTLWLNSAKTVGIFSGTGTPEGSITASVGSTFHRTNGGALTSYYVKESGSGNTGWVAK